MTIKSIIWDWGGVCCVAGEHFSNKKMLEQAKMSPEEMSNASKEIEHEFYKGKISEEEFWNRIIQKYGLQGISLEELRKSYFESSPVYHEIHKTILSLKRKYRNVLLSDLAIDMSTRIRNLYKIENLFDTVIFSHEVGMMKPDEKIYRLMLEKLKMKPEDCLFIDDSKKNIEAANEIGIKTIHFQNVEQTLNDLKKLNMI